MYKIGYAGGIHGWLANKQVFGIIVLFNTSQLSSDSQDFVLRKQVSTFKLSNLVIGLAWQPYIFISRHSEVVLSLIGNLVVFHLIK